jgi:hypothetical protein
LEVLAIAAHRQPVTLPEINFIRRRVDQGRDSPGRLGRSLSGYWGRAARRGLAVRRLGAARKSVFGIVDQPQRRLGPQTPCARRVPAARRHLLRCRSSTIDGDRLCRVISASDAAALGTRSPPIPGQAPTGRSAAVDDLRGATRPKGTADVSGQTP